jgi:hypothetical protein
MKIYGKQFVFFKKMEEKNRTPPLGGVLAFS